MPLQLFQRVRELRGVRLFGLGEQSSIERECADFDIASLGSNNIAGTAGAIAALDLTISVDTMIAHLAGSLGRPVWAMLNQAADYRWPIDGETTPWYPTMRLYHRKGRGWEGLMGRVAEDLESLIRLRTGENVRGKPTGHLL